MNHTVLSPEQLDRLLAHADIGKRLCEFVTARARESAETGGGPDASFNVDVDADFAMDFEAVDVPDEVFDALRVHAVEAAQAVYEEAREMRQQHAEAEKDVARGLR